MAVVVAGWCGVIGGSLCNTHQLVLAACPVPCPPLQILHMESLILNTLGFRLAVVTPKHFMKRFTTAAGSDEKEIQLVNVRVMCFGRSLPSPTPVYSAS